MRVVVVFDHPYGAGASKDIPHRRSYSAALAASAIEGLTQSGHDVDLIDLAADHFNPVMSADDLAAWRKGQVVDPVVADYQRRILQAEHLVFVFPVWWEAMPAGTKGFIDKVMTKELVFSQRSSLRPFSNHFERLRGVTVITVMTTPKLLYRWLFGSPVTKIMFRGTFRKIGVRKLTWLNYVSPASKTLQERRDQLTTLKQRFAAL